MSLPEWVDLKTLKLLSQHTTAIAGGAASFWLTSNLIRWAAGSGKFSDYVEYSERFILAVLLAWLTIQMFMVLWKGRVKLENGIQLLSLVA